MKRNMFNVLKISILTLGLASASTFGDTQSDASTIYEIKKGETLYSLAKESNLTVSQLMQLNNLTSTTIYAGENLMIPNTITIKKGDTLYSLAKKYDTTVSQLKHINQLNSTIIYAGKKLIIPTTVIVKKGDTLYRIAKNYGLTVPELKEINGLESTIIFAGQKLIVAKNGNMESLPGSYDASKVKVEVSVKDGFTFDAEEPRKFIVQYKQDGSYFSRIEVLDSNANLIDVKENSIASLKGNKITEHQLNNINYPFYKDAKFFLHGSNSKTQTNIVVKELDGKLIRFTIHYLNKEESEGITPHMIDILHTTKLK
ncbi:LysM peptidoglycan-binding domain-containing protein [Metabacillus herbersteinensis]|uniref:LysM peptidoglycan-binding domain-containing protein n=1 Tax=Metabacillus herbersteinensis TaxID=283816 RepID=A0ABV6GDG9_9BACI